MSEAGDYTPGAWTGYDFKEAKKSFDIAAGRSYAVAQDQHKKVSDLIPVSLTTQSPSPLVIICDVTGSMGQWPATIFSKLPYLDNECREYLGEDAEISFAANGDHRDSYPLQVRPFAKGRDLEVQLKELIIESGGSGPESVHESYELAALYYARSVEMPNATRKPILIFIGDEHFYETIDPYSANIAHIKLDKRTESSEIFQELKEKFSVYLIRKPYPSYDAAIVRQWTQVLGEDHIAELPSPDRVVDVIFGILAKETNRIAYFKEEIEDRQRPDQVATVYKSLKTIHALTQDADDSKSIMLTHIKGKATKRLLP